MTTTTTTLNVEPHWPGLLRWLVERVWQEMEQPHGCVVAAFITGGEDTALLAAVETGPHGEPEVYWRESVAGGVKWHKHPATLEQMKERAFCYREYTKDPPQKWTTYVRGEEVPE